MSLLQVLYFPDERLRKVASPVKEVNEDIKHIIDNMFETMYYEKGIGLAATQVNIHQRIIVIDIFNDSKSQLVLINPQLITKSGEISIEEGCLSIPKQYAFIPRAEFIKVNALDRNGNSFTLETSILLAICIQHEIDHLNGKLFIDYLSTFKQDRIKNKMKKIIR